MFPIVERDTDAWPAGPVNTLSPVSHFPLWAVVSSMSDIHSGIQLFADLLGHVLVTILIAEPYPHSASP